MTLTIDASHPSARHTLVAGSRSIGPMMRDDGFALVPALGTCGAAQRARSALIAARGTLAQRKRSTWCNPKDTARVGWASYLVPELRESPFRPAARALAADILGCAVVERFDYALVTPPGGPGAGWHRDVDSFTLPGADPRVHVWVALQDVDESNGCLSYVPRGDERDEPADAAIACAITAGGALVHDEHCLHRSGDNTTDSERWAWVLQFTVARPSRRVLFACDRARARILLTPARRLLAQSASAA